MRRSCLLGTMMMTVLLLLGGCSGLGKFFSDTITLPGMNPNLPFGLSENTDRARGEVPEEAPILPESGNIWPGPPKPLPTLSDVSRLQGGGLSGDLKGGDTMHDGGSMSMGEHDSIAHGVTGADSFSGGGLDVPPPDASSRQRTKPQAGQGGSITIPNGDGTSTVIEPDGTVKTVKTPPR